MTSGGYDGNDGANSLFVNFNQDSSSLAIGTKTGYKLYSIDANDNLERLHEDSNEDIFIVERLFSSSLLAVVSLSSPRQLRVCHFKKKTEICNHCYPNTILSVKLNRQRLVVCLEESILIHNIRDMKLLHTIRDIPRNVNGLCALSPNSDNCYLAYPANQATGEVHIFDALNLQNKILITAHDNPLAAIAFDSAGAKIATASEKGTVIRVFLVNEGECIYEFRRGYARCVNIFSLSFSSDSLFLCASSNTETVHIFKLEDPQENIQEEEPKTWMGLISTYGKKALTQSASYWPSVADMMNQWRSFATARLPLSGSRNVCAIINVPRNPRVLIATADGYLYIYDLNTNEGGDCTLVKQHRLDESIEPSRGSPSQQGTMSYAAAVRGSDSNSVSNSNISTAAFPSISSSPSAETASASPPLKSETATDYDGDFPPISQKTGF